MFERTSRGYYRAHGRADDTMNLGGIKVMLLKLWLWVYEFQVLYVPMQTSL